MKSTKEYSSRVNALTMKTAENILEIGLAMLDAKKQLSDSDYLQFLIETKHNEETCTVRKWNRIGEAYLKLKSVIEYLPPVFSTIYQLSSLQPSELESLIKNNILSPVVTTKEINDELHPKSYKSDPIRITLEFDSSVDELTMQQVIDLLDSYKSVLSLKLSTEAQELLHI